MRRSFLPLLALTMASAAVAQSLDKGSIEGALFYKEHAFLEDDSVQVIEYRSSKTFDQITYVETAKGARLRINNDQVAFVLCYPGRGEIGRQEALPICDLATARFPKYAAFIAKVKEGWVKMTPEEEKRQTRESGIRNSFLAHVLGEVRESAEPKSPPPPGGAPSLLDDHRKNLVPATPAPASPLDVKPSPAPAASPEKIPGVPAELQQQLQEIKE